MAVTAASTSSLVANASPVVAKSNVDKPVRSLARSRSDLLGAFSMLYEAYLKAGLESPKASGIRITPFHMLPTTEVLVAKLRGEVISTVSLIGDGYLGIPMQSMYPEQVNGLREQGLRLAEVGCLADRRDSPVRFIDNFKEMTRLLSQVASVRGIDALVVATHPRHARFYKRALGFEQLGDESTCPYAQGNPAVALFMHFEAHRGTDLYDRYFGDPIPNKELTQYYWDSDTRDYFKSILERDRRVATNACVTGGLASASISGILTC